MLRVFPITQKARVTHEMHAVLEGRTHGLKLNVMTITISNVCPMCETVFLNFATARIQVVEGF